MKNKSAEQLAKKLNLGITVGPVVIGENLMARRYVMIRFNPEFLQDMKALVDKECLYSVVGRIVVESIVQQSEAVKKEPPRVPKVKARHTTRSSK